MHERFVAKIVSRIFVLFSTNELGKVDVALLEDSEKEKEQVSIVKDGCVDGGSESRQWGSIKNGEGVEGWLTFLIHIFVL